MEDGTAGQAYREQQASDVKPQTPQAPQTPEIQKSQPKQGFSWDDIT